MNEGGSPNHDGSNYQSEQKTDQPEKSLALLDDQMEEYWQEYRGLKNRSTKNIDGPYLQLGIDLSVQGPSSVSREIISKNSMQLLKQFHPDKWVALGIDKPENEERLRLLNALVKNVTTARETLLNEAVRRAYDSSLGDAEAQTSSQQNSNQQSAQESQSRTQSSQNTHSRTYTRPGADTHSSAYNGSEDPFERIKREWQEQREADKRKSEVQRHQLQQERELLDLSNLVVDKIIYPEAVNNLGPESLRVYVEVGKAFSTLREKQKFGAYHSEVVFILNEQLGIKLEEVINSHPPDIISAKYSGGQLTITLIPE